MSMLVCCRGRRAALGAETLGTLMSRPTSPPAPRPVSRLLFAHLWGSVEDGLPGRGSLSTLSALIPNHPGIAFLLRRRTSSRTWCTPCCKPTAPPACRCSRATSWYGGQDGGGDWACVRWRGQRSCFMNSPSLSTCPSEVKRTMKNQSSRDRSVFSLDA